MHRLMARRRQVDDRKAPVAKTDARLRIDPDPLVIGAAMGERVCHAPDDPRIDLGVADDSRYSAHTAKFVLLPLLGK